MNSKKVFTRVFLRGSKAHFIFCLLIFLFLVKPLLLSSFPPEKVVSTPPATDTELAWSRLVPTIREFVVAKMKDYGVPGLSLAVVHKDKIIMAEGFGLRDVEKNLPVTAQTRFVLGSTTKAFTTLALGMLVDEGKMSWDEPVRNLLPGFSLMDEWATLRCSVRDMITHRTGLPRHDLVWNGSDFGPEEIVNALRFLEPSRDFRSAFQYNNLMYIAAGVIVSRVAGISWENFLRERVFTPLRMKNSGCTLAEYLNSAEFSYAYTKSGEKLEIIPFPPPEKKIMSGGRASGSVHSTAEDMTQWLRLHLNLGTVDGQRLISPERLKEMHTPQIVRPANPQEEPEIEHTSYGLGWMVDSYRGHYRVNHTGSTMGFSSLVVVFPRENLAAAVLTNMNSPVATLVGNYVSDLGLSLPPVDWQKKLASRGSAPPPSKPAQAKAVNPGRPMSDYTGEFSHPAYGKLRVVEANGGLFMIFRDEKISLEPFGRDLFRPKTTAWRRFPLHFLANNRDELEKVAIPFEPAVKDIVFIRVTK